MSGDGNPIEAVRARLDGGRLWLKGNGLGNYVRQDSSVCVVGAACSPELAGVVDDLLLAIAGVVAEQYPERTDVGDRYIENRIGEWNDHPLTTWADVDLVLDKAARRWDETS